MTSPLGLRMTSFYRFDITVTKSTPICGAASPPAAYAPAAGFRHERVQSMVRKADDPLDDRSPLRNVAVLRLNPELEDRHGAAAINARHSTPEATPPEDYFLAKKQLGAHLSTPTRPSSPRAGVAIIGHSLRVKPQPCPDAAELNILERNPEGTHPHSACVNTYSPDMDHVHLRLRLRQTMPRLLTLASNAHTVVLGPSARVPAPTPRHDRQHPSPAPTPCAPSKTPADALRHGAPACTSSFSVSVTSWARMSRQPWLRLCLRRPHC